jgi:hypothetical protein
MAKGPRPEKSVDDIRQEIAHSRHRMARDLTGLSYELDFPLKFRKSFQRNTVVWISAAVLTGIVLTARATSCRKPAKGKARVGSSRAVEEKKKSWLEAGLTIGLLRFAGTLARPIVVSFLKKKLGSYAAAQRR